jgi:hypothetical protein
MGAEALMVQKEIPAKSQTKRRTQLDRIASIRVMSVSRNCIGVATVVIEFVSKDRFAGRPGTRGRIEFNFETDEENPQKIGAQARRRLTEQFAQLEYRDS